PANDADKFNMQQFSWGIGVENRFAASPFSLFARYEGNWTEFRARHNGSGCCGANNAETIEHMFKAGFRVYLNENTLLFNDRNGATLDIRDPFPSAYRAFGRTNTIGNSPP